ncbi:MAG TPA: AAA family ATPase [Bryobacteraceae bacterium]|nr:AAA family ATPase [Bryobacteraceae bacterium]
MRRDYQATSPLLWVATQFGRFLGDGYREIRGLIASNAPDNLKKAFTGSMAALILALLTVIVIASQLHPVAVILAVVCVLLIVYGRTLFKRLALFAGYFLCGFVLFIGAGLITTVPLEKSYPLLAKAIAVGLFVVLCLVIPALLSMRPRLEIAASGASWAASGDQLRKPALTFADVGGMEEAKKQIRELVQANLNGKKFGQYGVFRNGILLHGPRGTGKTFLAEATAGEFGLKYLYVSASSLVGRYVGTTEGNIESAFAQAKTERPIIIFIDEIDAVGTKRQQLGEADDTGGAARMYNSTTNRLMGCIDEVRKTTGVVLMAATNFYDGLDRALIREGRFDLHVRLDLPNKEERALIFEAQLAKRPSRRLDVLGFAKRTPGWSAAKIGTLVDRAAFFAAEEQRKIEERDLTRALADTGGKDRGAFKEVEWEDVVLSPDTEADLRNLVRLMDPVYGERLKLAMPTGLLLIGSPGTGKTMIARLIATQTKRSFYPITAADILGGATGASVKKLTELFARAQENSPSIIFIDEMDGLLPRNNGFQSQHDIQLVEQARSLISELEPQHNVFLIGTTNHLDSIDAAILRGGRFSEKIEIGTPHESGYQCLLKKHLDGVRLVEALSVELLAERMKGISPADLEAICHSAKRMAMRRMAEDAEELPPLTWNDFTEAMKRVQVQFSERS